MTNTNKLENSREQVIKDRKKELYQTFLLFIVGLAIVLIVKIPYFLLFDTEPNDNITRHINELTNGAIGFLIFITTIKWLAIELFAYNDLRRYDK